MEPASPAVPADSFTTELLGKPTILLIAILFFGYTPRLPWEGVKLRSPQFNRGVVITGSPGNSLDSLMKKNQSELWEGCELSLFSVLTLYKIAQGNNLSDSSEKLLWRCEGGARIYEFFAVRKPVVEVLRWVLIREQANQVNEFMYHFLSMGRCKNLGKLKFLRYGSALSWGSVCL